MSVNLKWNGEQTLEAAAARLAPLLDQHTLKIEAKAKAELYPGHGKITGTLQRSIGTTPARREGRRLIAKIATRGVPYARAIHRRYEYLTRGMQNAGAFQG
jgi:hypothetical protein